MDTEKEAYLYQTLDGGAVRCDTCGHACVIPPGKLGFCKTRENRGGTLYSLEYGLISSVNVNPVEKKPLFHFYPGSSLLTIGSWSCTFVCPWCQNDGISKTGPQGKASQSYTMTPQTLLDITLENGCAGTSMSFSEPTTFLEYAVDVFKLTRDAGLYNTVVTNGYFTPAAADLMLESGADAFNIDIKGDAETYAQYCSGDIEKVWQNVKKLRDSGAHIELTTLVIPDVNDSDACLNGIAARIVQEAGPETPWHISRYHPAYRFHNPPTPVRTLEQAYDIGKENGLLYIYAGNIPGHRYENTCCPSCGEELIRRVGFEVQRNRLGEDRRCPECGQEIPIVGRWERI